MILTMWMWERANQCEDDPEIYDGAHVSVQVVGRRLEEERMLAVAGYIGTLLNA